MTFYPDGPVGGRPERAVPRLPAPGWMPDPSETHIERYWDGARWTARTRDRVTGIERTSYASAAYAPRAWTPAEPRRRNPGKTIFIVLAVVIVALNIYRYADNLGFVPAWAQVTVQGAATQYDVPTDVERAKIQSPASGYPTFGSTELVREVEEALLTQQDRIDVTEWSREVGQEAILDAYREASVQNPYVFNGGGTYREIGPRAFLEPRYVYTPEESERRRAVTYAAVQVGLDVSGASAAASDRDKVIAIHDYIVGLADYDYGAYDLINEGVTDAQVEQSQEAYGILADGTAVCSGYAHAFLAMARAAGLEAVQVTGDASSGMTTGGHAWNKVLVDGQWLVVDTTWDDPEGAPRLLRDYLLLEQDHPLLATRSEDLDWIVDSEVDRFA